ncbi:hypothetical protein JB92DRAFT_1031839 [Gautieria morchelliformis]|nr:hypothetical protein JB92DRAFT_1031839 [Gautieria morchelliformis]
MLVLVVFTPPRLVYVLFVECGLSRIGRVASERGARAAWVLTAFCGLVFVVRICSNS